MLTQELLDGAKQSVITAIQTVDYAGYGAANATGQLAASIQSVVTPNGFAVVATGPAAKYVGTLRYGRRAGKPVPVSAIYTWMEAKGIAAELPEAKRKGVAWAIAKRIQASGTTVVRNNLAPTIIWDGAVTEIQTAIAAEVAGLIVKSV